LIAFFIRNGFGNKGNEGTGSGAASIRGHVSQLTSLIAMMHTGRYFVMARNACILWL
jgi:hypothetical protein